jgi:AraC-like DNA-binding protein
MKEYVQAMIDYIEVNIHEPITSNDIEKHIGYSKYYMHRVFRIYTGYSIMEYVRNRKMEYAHQSLSQGMTVLDVAVSYGYQSERAFRRVFKKYFKILPSCISKMNYQIPPKIILENIGGINVLPYLNEPIETKLPDLHIIGVKKVSKSPEEDSINFMNDYAQKHGISPISEIGSDASITEKEREEGLRGYVQFLVVSKAEYDKANEAFLLKETIPSSKAMKCTIKDPFIDPFVRIPTGWKKLFAKVESSYQVNIDISLTCFEEKVETVEGVSMNLYTYVR